MKINKKVGKDAVERIFKIAKEFPDFEQRNIALFRKVAMKHNIKIGERKSEYCKYCNTFFKPENVRVRVNNHKVTYTCLNCNRITRFNYKTKPDLNKKGIKNGN